MHTTSRLRDKAVQRSQVRIPSGVSYEYTRFLRTAHEPLNCGKSQFSKVEDYIRYVTNKHGAFQII